MFGRKNYDLRYKDMIWFFRDSFVGAADADTEEVKHMKKALARNMLIAFSTAVFLGLFFWLKS